MDLITSKHAGESAPPGKLEALLQHPAVWQAGAVSVPATTVETVTTGYATLDQVLPGGGWPVAELVELLCPQWGVGEIQLLAPALARLSRQARWIVWVGPPWIPYGPALAACGVSLDKLVVVRARHARDRLWALEQALASGACSAVLGWPDGLQSAQVRRLQLAARKGRCLGVLLRSHQYLQQASPAPLRIEIGLPDRRLNVCVRKCRGAWGSPWLSLPWWDAVDHSAGFTRYAQGLSPGGSPEETAISGMVASPLVTSRPEPSASTNGGRELSGLPCR